ncbi:glycosyltransferase family 39 protein [Pseudonocardia aurantiaca]|uniref:Glycosyltransferase family 39 protein n=1 Tax=Pseudonocardia aurantiaca TaxID=75290 RepID=A0ABW4FRX2_9PSEU
MVPPPGRGSPLARRAALGGLLAGTAVLYLWGLSASGWANAFYAAAAQAGSQSWEAWFFGSSDAANSITVDKPPASLWITGLSVRIFGLSSWSVLVPEALMGVGAVWLLYATVRRTAGHAAGLLAAGALALTPVAVLMFRYNNPDALLVLLLIGSAYTTLRAVESGRTRWLLLAGALIGFGFLTKMLQAFLVLPALSAAWMTAAPVGIGRRIRDLALAGVAMLVTAGWWVLVVDLWPADARPYIGGSQDNNVLELVFGYNGFGRLTGNEVGSVGGQGGAGGAGRWGETGLTRLFNAEMGGQAAWLLPAALLLLLALLWYTRRAPRTDHLRAATIVWGGWLLVTGLVFSLMAGIFHSYYLVALAPAIAAVAGIGAVVLWRRRAELTPRITLAVVLAGTAVWAFVLLGRTPDWQPWLAWTVLVVGVVAAFGLVAVNRLPRTLGVTAVAVAVVVALAGPAGYSVVTAATPHSGAIPTAGPEGSGMRMAGGRGGGGPTRQLGTGQPGTGQPGTGQPGTGQPGTGQPGTGQPGTGQPGTGQPGAGGPVPNGGGFGGARGGNGQGAPGVQGAGQAGGRGGFGGLLGASTPPAGVVQLLEVDASSYKWVAAASGSNNAAGYQLATGDSVMPVGGYNGTDPSPTLAQFQQLVAAGQIHYFIGGGMMMGGASASGSNQSKQISDWVAATFTPVTVDGVTLYDLSAAS